MPRRALIVNFAKGVVICLTVINVMLAAWHILDESAACGPWQSSTLMLVLSLWCFFPVATMVLGFFTRLLRYLFAQMLYSAFLFQIYVYYALKGPSDCGLYGARHMHIFFVPVMIALKTLLAVICFALIQWGVRMVMKRRKANVESPGDAAGQ